MRAPEANRGKGAGRDQLGFTLTELLIVIALMAIIGLIALPNVAGVFKVSLNSATRDLASTIKEAFNSTVMTKKVHRLVFDLDKKEFWVEFGPNSLLMDTEESRKKTERLKRYGDKKKVEEMEERAASQWTMARGVTRKKLSLPRGVEYEDVSTEQAPDPITEGKAYTHFFPNGMIEQTIIHIKDNSKHRGTLVIQPLVGNTKVYDRYVPKEEAISPEMRAE